VALLERRWGVGKGELIVVEAPLDVEMRLHQVLIALALGADNRLMLDLLPRTHGFKVRRCVCAPAVGDEVHGGAVAQTGRIEDHQRHPGGFGGRDHPRQHGPRIPLEDDQTPPVHPINGDIRAAAVDEVR
jgi:hypothetical protein